MPDINEEYERKLAQNIAKTQQEIEKAYQKAASKATAAGSTVNKNVQDFSYKTSPVFEKKIDGIRKEFADQVYVSVQNAVQDSWKISKEKNEEILKDLVKKGKLPPNTMEIDPHREALRQFLNRQERGMNLSQRIWKGTEQMKTGLEQQLGAGIGRGQKSDAGSKKNPGISDQIKDYLLKPEGYAENEKPGRGVYRSAKKNALRVAATETNMAYRTADYIRWQEMPFITGIEIRLSNNHPKYDICDEVKGKYPKDFKFRGWHPRCRCAAIPLMASDKDFEAMEDQLLAGEEISVVPAKQIKEVPKGFTQWVANNKERVAGWQNTPYWMDDNPEYVAGKVRTKPPVKTTPKPEIPTGAPPKPPADSARTPPRDSGTEPAAKQIGTQFTKIAQKIKAKVDDALQSIDKVHGDGVLDDIPFKPSQAKSFNGQFSSYTREGKASHITLSTHAKDKQVTIAHEMGHYLDLYSVGEKGKWASTNKDSPMAKVIAAANKSDLVKKIRATLKSGKITIKKEEIKLSTRVRKHLNYLVDEKEIWARSYAQYIAEKSGNTVMKESIAISVTRYADEGYGYQWAPDDFADLSAAIEEMMIELGWMVSR